MRLLLPVPNLAYGAAHRQFKGHHLWSMLEMQVSRLVPVWALCHGALQLLFCGCPRIAIAHEANAGPRSREAPGAAYPQSLLRLVPGFVYHPSAARRAVR